MKHSLVLLLGLTSLVLSSAPAYANNLSAPLDFDPSRLSIDRPHQLAQNPSEAPHLKQQNASIEMEIEMGQSNLRADTRTDPRKQINQTAKNRSLDRPSAESPVLESPVFDQSSPSLLNPPDRSSDRPSQVNVAEPSPFQLRDDLTDAELFEESTPHLQQEPRSASTSEPSVEFESSDAAFDQFFESLQSPSSPEPASSTDRSIDPTQSTEQHLTEQHLNRQTSDRFEDKAETRTENQRTNQRLIASSQSSPGLSFHPSPAPSSSSSPQTAALPPAIASSPVESDVKPDVKSNVESEPVPSATDPKFGNGELEKLFVGESDSLVAIAVGSAEGTRSPNGGKNPAYQGHVDPGNGVWNLGSFSYQHGASSPEEADAKQLARLRTQAKTIFDKAASEGLELTLEEKLNGIDLANQAPKAALDEWGYIDRLAEAYARGLTGSDAILWARVQSFIDPQTQTWDAPGLGNSQDRITRDQERRMIAIANAIANYLQDLANRPSQKPSNDQAHQGDSTEQNGITQLFTRSFNHLFASSSTVTKLDRQAELPIVQQVLSLNLSS